jgi:hypothetical protein
MKSFFELREQLKEAISHDPEDYVEIEDEDELEIEDLEATELMPRSPGERAFKRLHQIRVKKHPVAADHQHKASNPETMHQPFNGEQTHSMTENFKSGEVKLKSGEKINIDQTTAKQINNIFSTMSEQQRTSIHNDMMQDKKAFNKGLTILKASVE